MKRLSDIEKISILVILISIVLILIAFLLYSYIVVPSIELKGDEEIKIELNNSYTDPGAEAFIGKQDISNKIKVTGTVNTKKVGSYKIKYSVTNNMGNREREKIRIVKVQDLIDPTLKLKGSNPSIISYGSIYKEPGYTAKDNYDGNLTNKVVVKGTIDTKVMGEQELFYIVSDSSGNTVRKNRTIKVVDNEKPVITLKGKSKIVLRLNGNYTEPGYTAKDNYDGDLSDKVIVTGKINTAVMGVYEKNYTVKDSHNNKITVTRTVQVGTQDDIDAATYVKVSIKEQTLWFYKNNQLVLTSDIVSGQKGSHDTTTGRFRIASMARGTYLIGDDYRNWVDYWMLFNPSAQQGFHDAAWRYSFGGNIYTYSGSHGCVNMPFEKARALFNELSPGTLVIIY